MFTQALVQCRLLRCRRFVAYGLLGVLFLLLQVRAIGAQGLVIIPVPLVEGTSGENGWYVSDVLVSWPLPPEASDVVGCQDTLIDYDSAGVFLTCAFSLGDAQGAAELAIKRDATPPSPILNVPINEPLMLVEGVTQPLMPTYDPAVEVSPVQFFVDTDQDAVFDDAPLFEAVDGLAEEVTTPSSIAWRFVDEAGNETLLFTEVVVLNAPPSAVLDGAVVHLGNAASLFLSFSDPGVLDTHSAAIDWGDGIMTSGIVVEDQGSGMVSGAHIYDKPGGHTAVFTVTDKDGGTDTAVFEFSTGSPQEVQAALGATFEDPAAAWNTIINGVFPLVFTTDGSEPQAVFSPDPDGCLGMLSWEPADGQTGYDGPALVFCLASTAVDEQAFNSWSDGGGAGIIPDLAIPLSPLANEQPEHQLWTNAEPFAARLFTAGCGESRFRRYADLLVAAGDLIINAAVDDLGRPELEIAAALAHLAPQQDAWAGYRDRCETAELLPETALAGTALNFAGGTYYMAPDPATSFGQFALLEDQVSALAFDGRLAIAEADKLDHVLDKVREQWRDVSGDQALHGMVKFVDDVNKLVDVGQLQAVDGSALTNQALSVADLINSPTSPPSPIPHPSVTCGGETGPCENTLPACIAGDSFIELYVDAGAAADGADGSWKRPFATISAALEQAAKQSACGVRIYAVSGTYRENLNISRHTYIVGAMANVFLQGSITHSGPHVLHLERLNLEWRPGSGGAAIFADHPCARLVLLNTHISGYPGYGLRQRGGSLDIRNSTVVGTTALLEHVSQGSGIYLSCGVRARLVDVWLDHNESSGLQIAGEGTEVDAALLTVSRTGIHPTLAQYLFDECPSGPFFGLQKGCVLLAGTGAIYVTDGGSLEASRLLVEDNLNIGVHAADGSEVLLEHAAIRLTKRVLGDRGISSNVATTSGGHVRLHNFAVESSFIGLLIFGEIDAHFGLVTGHQYGASVPGSGYDLRRITDDVLWVDNDINIYDHNPDTSPTLPPIPCIPDFDHPCEW